MMAAVAAVALLCHAGAASARPTGPTASAPIASAGTDWRPVAIGLGAVAGITAFNLLALGPGALPGGFAYAAGETVPAEMSVAISRVYATAAGVIGGWAGYYSIASSPDASAAKWPVDRRLLAAGGGAILGTVAFNLLAAPIATVPLAGGALQAVPYDVALGSRLIATTAAGAGAIAGDWLYSQRTGTPDNSGYLLTLGAGALAGVAIGNYLTAGTIGTIPYYAGAGVANAGGGFASAAAQAASRIYVVTYGVLGALAADYWYRR